jgi:hypothetical protein
MKITRRQLRQIINEIIIEQFTIPTHNKHSGFEYYSELDSFKADEILKSDNFQNELDDSEEIEEQGYVPPGTPPDDERAGEGGPNVYQYTENDCE